ncbi:hypothetical protein TWF506_000136 [Arthrobotrys conoides]|uniref:Uncharacterized protein n=1 Tax=Arthrobotrys conoides TaxID=74498 RepID=A0AAN8RQB3_9PEZI
MFRTAMLLHEQLPTAEAMAEYLDCLEKLYGCPGGAIHAGKNNGTLAFVPLDPARAPGVLWGLPSGSPPSASPHPDGPTPLWGDVAKFESIGYVARDIVVNAF